MSVVIPTYNRAGLLGRSIRSVLGQTYDDLELIVVDDASSDNTAEVVLHLGDERIRYIRRDRNGGPAAARNTGITASTGKFMAFNDSDDEWFPDKLERQMKVFDIVPPQVGVVYCDSWNDSNGKKELYRAPHIMPEDGMIFRRLLTSLDSGMGLQTAVVRRECFEKAGMLDETLHAFEDAEFFIRVSKHYCLYHMSVPLVNRWRTPGSLVSNHEFLARGLKIILTKYWEDIRVDSRLKSWYFMKLGWETHLTGHQRTACEYFARGLIASPSESLVFLLAYLRYLMRYLSREQKSNVSPSE